MTMGAIASDGDGQRHGYAFVNELANHPSIRPTCGGDGKSTLDLAPFLDNPLNRAFIWDLGCFLFQWSAPETFEVHAMILPEGRGPEGYRMAGEGIAYIVGEGAERLWARVEKGDNALRHYTTQAGFTACGTASYDMGFGPVECDLYQWKKPCPRQ
jgi:hypothetical protein